jgi:hypothetical protein
MSLPTLPDYLETATDSETLRFLISRASVYKFNCSRLVSLSKATGIRADLISRYIANGAFTTKAATRIENAVGRDLVHWEWLVNPVHCLKSGDIF